MKDFHELIDFLNSNKLVLATAESCTGGGIMTTLSNQGNCGDCLYIGYVTYHTEAKIKELGVKEETIRNYSLTSEEVAKEMVRGVFKHQAINVAIATTGITGSESMDGIQPGTVCFAWAFKHNNKINFYSETKCFKGSPIQMTKKASYYALSKIKKYYKVSSKNNNDS
ncbi:MAG: nicotinamide-nucleotide amidohydrolase family protein [Tatlockia sp.]|nr:nicotinamide-nucleotide amidohydrolase family protein [Tatlockia sp.]